MTVRCWLDKDFCKPVTTSRVKPSLVILQISLDTYIKKLRSVCFLPWFHWDRTWAASWLIWVTPERLENWIWAKLGGGWEQSPSLDHRVKKVAPFRFEVWAWKGRGNGTSGRAKPFHCHFLNLLPFKNNDFRYTQISTTKSFKNCHLFIFLT